MKEAFDALIVNTPAGKNMQLHIVNAPGTSDATLRAALANYITSLPQEAQSLMLSPIIEIVAFP